MSQIPQVSQLPIPARVLSLSLHPKSSLFPHLKSRHTHSFQCLLQAAETALFLVLVGEGRLLFSLLLVPWFLRLHSRGWNLLFILLLHDSLKAQLVKGARCLDWSWGDDRQRKGGRLWVMRASQEQGSLPPHCRLIHLQGGAASKPLLAVLLSGADQGALLVASFSHHSS